MYHHIEKILYIKLEVDQKKFQTALLGKYMEIELDYNDEWKDIVFRDNKFIRLTRQSSYIDLMINKIAIGDKIIIYTGNTIDYDIVKENGYMNKTTGETCVAKTIQEAAIKLNINIRHVARIKNK